MMELLAFIRGKGHHHAGSIRTRDDWPDQKELHQDCLALEERGLIKRYSNPELDASGWTHWEPAESEEVL